MFSKCICHRHCLCVCLSHCLLLARSSLWSNDSKVKSLKDRSLKVFSKCICHFVSHVMFSHDPHQFCEVGVWSGRLECFESNTISEWVSDQGRPRAARAAKNKNPFSVFLGPQIMKKTCDHCLTIIYIHFENNRNCFWSPKNKKSDLYGNMPYKHTVWKVAWWLEVGGGLVGPPREPSTEKAASTATSQNPPLLLQSSQNWRRSKFS